MSTAALPPGQPVAPLQAFYSYADLARMWRVSPRTVSEWISNLRHEAPELVLVTRKRRPGRLVGPALIAASTAQALQDRHVLTPADRQAMARVRGFARRRGSGPPKSTAVA